MIKYRGGYKYQLAEAYSVLTSIVPDQPIDHDYISLSAQGVIGIRQGYAWDGPSGPTVDTKTFMRGSLIHDALYQLMRDGLLPLSFREAADTELKKICLEDGMWSIRAWWVYRAVRTFGGEAIRSRDSEIQEAP